MENIIGERIKSRRRELRMTQETLADKSCVSRATISALENGKCNDVLISTICDIALALDTNVDSFFTQTG